ncbi:PEPxxWA-CTERM sorting domain-containing protein [Phenylobacterium sp.]|uniref:Npun_F0296 family exosortase-dependent surface protein n=1 Tax=Phenylobacterium sp. TaxID=1871053 RepID=UPI0025F53E74|nr:PEPxxWA-CTERM sorting domain-containing protein [Phenylobacterium sp.]
MKLRTLAAASAALGLMAAASAANAAITVSLVEANDLFGTNLAANGQTMLWDFDSIAASTVAFSGAVWQGPQTGGASASPPFNGDPAGDTTKYASVAAGQTSTFSAINGNVLSSFSFYMGSPDTYNQVTFHLANGTSQTFNGEDIWGGTPQGTGDRTQGYRVYYNFGGDYVTSIDFSSSLDAFEFDGLAGTAVPEPGTWALMILGFGGAGAMIRRRKAAFA